MRLRLSKRFFASLMAAIASVTFTSVGTATLGAAAFSFSMQQAAAAEQIESSASSNTETAVTVDASGDKKASDDEESEEVEAEEELLEPDSTPIASVGSGGAAGSGAAGYSQGGAENVGNLDNAPQQQAGAQSVSPSASLPSDDLGFTTNSYADSIAEALADVEFPSVPAAIAAELELATPAKPTSSESSSSSNGNDAPLASGSFAPMGTSSWFGSYASNSSAPVSQVLSSSNLPITLLGDAGASSGTSSLNNASLKLVDFTSASVDAAKDQGWMFSDASIATESGVYTTTAPWIAITNSNAWTTTTVEGGKTNRTYYAALMTVKVSSLSQDGGVLLTPTATSTGTKTNDMREGIGYDYTGGVYKVESAWVGNKRGDGLINQDLSSFADANGLVTVAIIYKGNDSQQAQGVTIFVADQTKDDTGLKGADAPGGNPRMFLADAAGVQYTNLYLFGMENGTAITNADMQSMMKEAGSYYWVGGENDNAWDASSKNWTHYGSGVAVAIGNNGGNANTNVVFTAQEKPTQVGLAQDTTIGSITMESRAMVTVAPTEGESHSLTVKDLVLKKDSYLSTGAPVNVTGTVSFSVEDGDSAGWAIYSDKDSTISAHITSESWGQPWISIDKSGTSTLTLSGDNTGYSDYLNVEEGTLKATGENSLGNAFVIVSDGATLSLAGGAEMNADTIELGNGSIISFENGSLLNLSQLNLAADEKTGDCVVTWNLEGYNNFTGSGTATLIQGIDMLEAAEGFSWDTRYVNTPDNITAIALEYDENAGTVVLTYSMDGGRDLIWDGENGTSWTAASNWHVAGQDAGTSVFGNGDNVQFTAATPNATTVLGADVSAGTMTIDNGAAVTLDTNVYNLTAKELVTNGGSLTKTGTGTATFGDAGAGNNVTLHTLQVDEGTVEFNQHVTVDANRINVAYAVKDAKTGVSAVFNDGLDFTGSDSKNYSMVVGFENTVVLGGESNLGDNKVVGIARNGTLELQAGAKATVGSVLNSSAADNNGTLKLGKGAIFNITNANSSSTLTNIENNGGTLNVSGGLTVHSDVRGDGVIVYNGPAGKTMQLNGGGEMGKITVTSGDFVTTGAQGITLGGLDVQGGTAHVGNSGAVNLGDVNLTGGKLVLNTTVSAESLTTTSGSTLTFAGIDDKILTTSGNINLGSGTTFDLSNITYRTDVAQQEITLATSNTGAITLGGNYSFTNPKSAGADFSLKKDGNNLVLVVEQTITDWPDGTKVRYTYTDTQGEHVTYESTHAYDFSAADGGVVEFNPGLFTNGNDHTYTDNTAKEMPLHADTTFVVEEGNTVILGRQVIGNNNQDGGHSGSFTKDGGGTLEMALNSGVFTYDGQDLNHFEGDVIVKEGTLHVLAHSKVGEDPDKPSMLAGRADATVIVEKDATLILDATTGILMPDGSEGATEANNHISLQACHDQPTTISNMVFDKYGIRPEDARDGGRVQIDIAHTLDINDMGAVEKAITIEAADITLMEDFTTEGNVVIDNTIIKTARSKTGFTTVNMFTAWEGAMSKFRNNSILEIEAGMALVYNTDVDKTSKVNYKHDRVWPDEVPEGEDAQMGYLAGTNKIEVAYKDNGGVAERTIGTGEIDDIPVTTIDYVTDQYWGMTFDSIEEGGPLSFAVTLSDMDLPEDLSNSMFTLTFTNLHSGALLTDEFVDVRDIMDVSLVIPQYTGGEWEELVAAVYAKFDGVDTVFMFQHVTPEPTTSTLSLLALAALAARRRRKG